MIVVIVCRLLKLDHISLVLSQDHVCTITTGLMISHVTVPLYYVSLVQGQNHMCFIIFDLVIGHITLLIHIVIAQSMFHRLKPHTRALDLILLS